MKPDAPRLQNRQNPVRDGSDGVVSAVDSARRILSGGLQECNHFASSASDSPTRISSWKPVPVQGKCGRNLAGSGVREKIVCEDQGEIKEEVLAGLVKGTVHRISRSIQ